MRQTPAVVGGWMEMCDGGTSKEDHQKKGAAHDTRRQLPRSKEPLPRCPYVGPCSHLLPNTGVEYD